MEYLTCKVCDNGDCERSPEIGLVRSNVRKFKDQKFTVWRCAQCQTLHCKEDIDFDYYYQHYPLSAQKIQYLTRISYLNRAKILRRSGIHKDDCILDYGCGAGLFLEYLKSKGFHRATGYDPYVDHRSDQKLLETKYDVVYSFGVIEHVPDPQAFLKDQTDLLKKNGRLVIATPNADGLSVDRPNSLLMHQPYHRHILSSQALEQLAQKCGLRLVRHERKNWLDTLHPGLNSRFVADYIQSTGGCVDSLFEKKKIVTFLTRPRLWWSFWFGYFTQLDDYMICTYQNHTSLPA